MRVDKSNSGQKTDRIEYSTSGMGASLYESSAVPTSLASIMRNALIECLVQIPVNVTPRVPGLHPETIWTSDDFDEPLPDDFWSD